jgi:pSer/pThr/pTyr-binding forkhead associated (FHA) protein
MVRFVADRLSILRRSFTANPQAFLRVRGSPVLIWAGAPAPKTKADQELLWVTQGQIKLNPGNDPLVFALAKQTGKTNAFGLGITLGRTPNNDVELDDPSVSRFHAYFQKDEQSGVWHVVDAESFNGSVCDGERLQPNRPAPVHDGSQLKFGGVEMRFLLAKAFEAMLRET